MKTILVPTDFSELSRASLSYAAMLATKMNVDIVLLHVIDISNSEMIMKRARLEEEVVQLAQEDAAILIADVRAEVGKELRIRFEYRFGHPQHRMIEQFAHQHDVGLIVMGLHGETGFRKVLMGAITSSVMSNSRVPVIGVPAGATFQLDRIFYATDMSNLPDELNMLVHFAKPFDATIHVIHVLLPDDPHPVDKQALREQTKSIDYAGIYFHVLRGGEVARSVDTFVRRSKAHMLAMFTHKLDFFETLFGRRLTEDIAAQNHLPLLTINKQLMKKMPFS